MLIRRLKVTDRPVLSKWIQCDPEHKDAFLPEFWYQEGRVSFVIEDDAGAVMFVKLEPQPPAMRLYIQFCDEPKRVAKAMLHYFSVVRAMVEKAGAEYMVFDTKNPRLAAFCQRAFGFSRVGESCDYVLLLVGGEHAQIQ